MDPNNTLYWIFGNYERTDHRWQLPGNDPVFTMVLVVYRYVKRMGELL